MSPEKRGETFVISGGEPPRPVEFNTFLLGLASTALIHLGEVPHPETGKAEKHLAMAQQSLDLLSMLREKTRGNLTADEERFFDNLLADLRLRFVAASR
ncbi:MAG: DUF1844 domain-containing protein [Myxococcaceae bacterium]